MSLYDSPADAPFQIKTEGETITLTFSQGLPITGEGTVQWNIPSPAHGCQSADGRGAYCGMLITISNTPAQPSNAPVDGTFYRADPTADPDAHTEDRIGEALVVGAFYEGEKRSRDEELTTSLIIKDLKPNTQYFVAGYAVDCQGRYHSEGVRAYSDEFANAPIDPDTPSSQTVLIGEGVIPTDGTGLTPGLIYEFEIELDPTFPGGSEKRTVKVSVDGTDVSTYEDLVEEINKAIALADNPPQSPVPPNSGRYYWDGEALFQWDGNQNVPIDALIEPVDPASPQFGDYWYNPDTEQLQRWGIPSPGNWNNVTSVSYIEDPRNLTGGDDYWYDGITAYNRCGSTWCEETLHATTIDPGEVVFPTECGVFWWNEDIEQLYEWNLVEERWVEQSAIFWSVAPNNVGVGTYWFDLTNERLFRWSPSWDEIELLTGSPVTGSPLLPHLVITEDEPQFPSPNLHWYQPSTETLSVWNDTLSHWDEPALIVWPTDPTDVESCELWWNSVSDVLHKWDSVHNEWDPISTFYQQPNNPFDPPSIGVGELWYNPDTKQLQRWDGISWFPVTFIDHPTDPTIPSLGDAWYNPETNEWFIWDTPTVGQWNIINPFDTPVDPFNIPNGTLWFDTTNNALFERQGSSWLNVTFSTQPLEPERGDKWFDLTNNKLMEWVKPPGAEQGSWVEAVPLATAEIDDNGNLTVTSTFTGSDSCVMILIPVGAVSGTANQLFSTGTAGHDFFDGIHDYLHYGLHEGVATPTTTVAVEQFLFDFLTPQALVTRQKYGTCGVSATPTYDQLDVGDDGSPDERRELADTIRSQLGYPSVEVELTPKQIDDAVGIALEELRLRSSVAYRRGFFFLDVKPGHQHYLLTDKVVGFHKIVTVMSAYRFTSAFLSTAHGSGVYGQVVLQHLYNMGTFDLLSYHLVSQYVEQLEHLFATRLTYHWDEPQRLLSFYHSFGARERVLLDVTLERTEQELLKDRWTKNWVERFAYAESIKTLAQVRGKFASLPGAGGGIALNAADLMTQHNEIKERLFQEIDDLVVNDVEDIGMQSAFIIG